MTTTTGKQTSGEMRSFKLTRSTGLGLMIIGAFLAFEVFNFSTTDFALQDVLGELRFLGMRWSTLLAVAFCAIDFAGIAKLFGADEAEGMVKETWFLFGAWVLAAGMNAILTWWGVSVALVNHGMVGASVISEEVMLRVVPIFVAAMVWLIRVLVIGSLSMSLNSVTGVTKKGTMRTQKPRVRRTGRKPMMGVVSRLKERLGLTDDGAEEVFATRQTTKTQRVYRKPMAVNEAKRYGGQGGGNGNHARGIAADGGRNTSGPMQF